MPDLQHAATDGVTEPQWTTTSVAADLTHHVMDGRPLYDRRFHAVQKFHAPGLAPARDGSGAFHIYPTGKDAYPSRFIETWGYYCGRASVQANDGWLHILPDGSPLSTSRFSWCGNFQEDRCAVRLTDGLYTHIQADGAPAYKGRYLYAGDYRDGIAVVRYADDGLCRHVDRTGVPVHPHCYLDLDVFHKGYARARDSAGCFHIDAAGRPLTPHRYQEVEPFYNGQARVLTHEGEYQVIDTTGRPLASAGSVPHDAFHQVSADIVGYWRSGAIAQAVDLGVFDQLPLDASSLACSTGIPEEPLLRLLGGLWELALVERTDDQLWCLTRKGQMLAGDSSASLAVAALEHCEVHRHDWARLREALRCNGHRSLDPFTDAAANPHRMSRLQRGLSAYARHDYPTLVDLLPFDDRRLILDVGGGTGTMAELLSSRFCESQVCVLERPEVCELANGIGADGTVQFVPGDLFREWPVRPDAFVLARVLHDWDNDRAAHILRTARSSVSVGCLGAIVELLLQPDSPFGRLCDLHLMVATGGRERTAEEYSELASRAGFIVRETKRTAGVAGVILLEAV